MIVYKQEMDSALGNKRVNTTPIGDQRVVKPKKRTKRNLNNRKSLIK